jgi:hypothetical protein
MRGSGRPERLQAPTCVHLYLWVFMIALSLSPMLYVLAGHDGFERSDACVALALIGLIQAMLYFAQRRCSSEDLLYWEGLLAATASVTTGVNLVSLLRTFFLLLAIVILSVVFAFDHDASSAVRHAQLRFGKLIIWAHKQRLRR